MDKLNVKKGFLPDYEFLKKTGLITDDWDPEKELENAFKYYSEGEEEDDDDDDMGGGRSHSQGTDTTHDVMDHRSLLPLSFGACYNGDCQCLHYNEQGKDHLCRCGHNRSFHAPNSFEAWKTLEWPLNRVGRPSPKNEEDEDEDETTTTTSTKQMIRLTNAFNNTTLNPTQENGIIMPTGSSQSSTTVSADNKNPFATFSSSSFLFNHPPINNPPQFTIMASPGTSDHRPRKKDSNRGATNNKDDNVKNPKIKVLMNVLYEEGHFHEFQFSTNNKLSTSLTELVTARFLPMELGGVGRRRDHRYNTSQIVEAVLDLIDSIWSPQTRATCISHGFANEQVAQIAFRDIDRMALRAINVLVARGGGGGGVVGVRGRPARTTNRDSTIITIGNLLLDHPTALAIVRSKIPDWSTAAMKKKEASSSLAAAAAERDSSLRSYIMEQENILHSSRKPKINPRSFLGYEYPCNERRKKRSGTWTTTTEKEASKQAMQILKNYQDKNMIHVKGERD